MNAAPHGPGRRGSQRHGRPGRVRAHDPGAAQEDQAQGGRELQQRLARAGPPDGPTGLPQGALKRRACALGAESGQDSAGQEAGSAKTGREQTVLPAADLEVSTPLGCDAGHAADLVLLGSRFVDVLL